MKANLTILVSFKCFLISTILCQAAWENGDIIVQESKGDQAAAVKIATSSPWTHCGIVLIHNRKPHVLEAIQPVRLTPLHQFLKRSVSGNYKVFRLKQPQLLKKIQPPQSLNWCQEQIGKDYDPEFQWSDQKMYCSELVWKMYHQLAKVELCPPRKLGSYNLKDPRLASMIKQRYGSIDNLPLHEKVVAPVDLANSPLLKAVTP